MCGIDFFKFQFGFGSVFENNSYYVWNEFGSIQFEKNTVWFRRYGYLLVM